MPAWSFGALGGKASAAADFFLRCSESIEINFILTLRSSYTEPCVRSPTKYQSLLTKTVNRLWCPGRESNPRRSP